MKRDYQPGQQLLKQIRQEARGKAARPGEKYCLFSPFLCLWKLCSFFKVLLRCLPFWKGLPNLSSWKKLFLPLLHSDNQMTVSTLVSAAWPLLSSTLNCLAPISPCTSPQHLTFFMPHSRPRPLSSPHSSPLSSAQETAIQQCGPKQLPCSHSASLNHQPFCGCTFKTLEMGASSTHSSHYPTPPCPHHSLSHTLSLDRCHGHVTSTHTAAQISQGLLFPHQPRLLKKT